MDLGIRDKVALVTAASRGLGAAIAYELAAEGARVVISARQMDTLGALAIQRLRYVVPCPLDCDGTLDQHVRVIARIALVEY